MSLGKIKDPWGGKGWRKFFEPNLLNWHGFYIHVRLDWLEEIHSTHFGGKLCQCRNEKFWTILLKIILNFL